MFTIWETNLTAIWKYNKVKLKITYLSMNGNCINGLIERGDSDMAYWKKIAMAVLCMTAALSAAAVPAYAASRKKISSVRVDVTSSISPESRFGEEEIDIEVPNGKYSYDYYEIENEGFEWMEDDIPEITIYLRANEGYYFSLTRASSVKLSGATYVKASKQDSSETLVLKVKLPSLQEHVGELMEVNLTNGGYAWWDEVRGAGSYELRMYRNGNGLGASILTTKNLQYDFRSMMNRPGTYQVKVRPCNKIKPENKSDWIESNTVSLTQDMVNEIKSGKPSDVPVRGEWKYDGNGWWYVHEDGSYTKNDWEEIKGEWYFFGEDGYMKTGWISWEGKEYYCMDNSGVMLRNATTPDGFILGSDGTKKTE